MKGRDVAFGPDTAIDGFEVGAVDTDDVTEDHGLDDDTELLDKLRKYGSTGGTGGISSYCA